MFVDHIVGHIVVLKDGGAALDRSNLRLLCGGCHPLKTAAERARRTAMRARGAVYGRSRGRYPLPASRAETFPFAEAQKGHSARTAMERQLPRQSRKPPGGQESRLRIRVREWTLPADAMSPTHSPGRLPSYRHPSGNGAGRRRSWSTRRAISFLPIVGCSPPNSSAWSRSRSWSKGGHCCRHCQTSSSCRSGS
jgi:hypothetical protein